MSGMFQMFDCNDKSSTYGISEIIDAVLPALRSVPIDWDSFLTYGYIPSQNDRMHDLSLLDSNHIYVSPTCH